jgi:hypothetical protein
MVLPASIGKLIDNSYSMIRESPEILYAPIAAGIIFSLMYLLLLQPLVAGISTESALLSTNQTTASQVLSSINLPGIISAEFVYIIITALVSVFLSGLYISFAAQKANGKKPSLEEAFRFGRERYIDLLLLDLGIFLVVAIIAVLMVIVFASLFAAASSSAAVVVLALGLLILIVIALIILFSIGLFEAAVVRLLEHRGVWDSIMQSIEIGRSNFISLFVILIILAIISVVFVSVPSIILGFISSAISQPATLILGQIFSVFSTAVAVFFYYSLERHPAAESTGDKIPVKKAATQPKRKIKKMQ